MNYNREEYIPESGLALDDENIPLGNCYSDKKCHFLFCSTFFRDIII